MKDFMENWGLSIKTISLLTGKSESSIAKYKVKAIPSDILACIRDLNRELIRIKTKYNGESMRINKEQIIKDIRTVRKEREQGEKTEMLYSYKDDKIVFSGHNWASNCFYSTDDLIRNSDFQIRRNPDGDLVTFGIKTDLTQEELAILEQCEIDAMSI